MNDIRLPENQERVSEREAKLAEYRERLSTSNPPRMSTHCTIAVLEILLKDGAVSTQQLCTDVLDTWRDEFDEPTYWNAVRVIHDYVETSGMNVLGGTDLPLLR